MPRKMPRVSTNTEVRLTAMTSSHSSSFMRMKRLSWVMPALLTRMSTWPSAFSASRRASPPPRGRANRKAARTRASRARRRARRASPSSCRRSRHSRLGHAAPWRSRRRCRREAPVTSAPFPVRSNIEPLLCLSASGRSAEVAAASSSSGVPTLCASIPVEAPGNPGEHAARAHLIDRVDAVRFADTASSPATAPCRSPARRAGS